MKDATGASAGAPVFPPCFNSEREYALWRKAAVDARTVMTPHVHCEECTKGYQWRMIQFGRCTNMAYTPEHTK